MAKVRFTTPLKTHRANCIPGNTELVLTAPVVDVRGTEYPRGTRIVPSSSGYDNARNSRYQDVVVLGSR